MDWSPIMSDGESPWDRDLVNDRRSAALDGKRHSDCSLCWKAEDQGLPSFRTSITSRSVMNRMIINFGNTCNLACTYCWHGNSSVWAAKTGMHPLIPEDMQQKREIFWKWWTGHSSEIKSIIISGGEPSLTTDAYEWIDRAKPRNKEILYNTSAATSQVWWKRFVNTVSELGHENRVIVRVSMDAVGDRFEWIRTGLSWKLFESNLHLLLEKAKQGNMLVRISPTLSCLTLEGMHDVAGWIRDVSDGRMDFIELDGLDLVEYPDYHRPGPWLCYFSTEIQDMLSMDGLGINRHTRDQMDQLVKVASNRSPSPDDARMMITGMDRLASSWGKPDWRRVFPRLWSHAESLASSD